MMFLKTISSLQIHDSLMYAINTNIISYITISSLQIQPQIMLLEQTSSHKRKQ